jgi:hypothetical protein
MEMTQAIDVFSDVSQRSKHHPLRKVHGRRTPALKYVGAYIVGCGGKPAMIDHDCRCNMQAEILTSIAGLQAALAIRQDGQPIIVHTDLKDIAIIMRKAMRGPARRLEWLLETHDAQIVADAWNYREYHDCHHYARVQAGIYGTEHPLKIKDLTPHPPTP